MNNTAITNNTPTQSPIPVPQTLTNNNEPIPSRYSGITLQAIGLTLGGGLCISFLTILAFGIAVMVRAVNIAPRCTSRHPNTIWRSKKDIYKERRRAAARKGEEVSNAGGNNSFVENLPQSQQQQMNGSSNNKGSMNDNSGNINSVISSERHPQDRGNPFLGWIPWTLHLSYDRMLRGIPGTGTRDGGMGGKLLGVNLDAIVLFRYHGKFAEGVFDVY